MTTRRLLLLFSLLAALVVLGAGAWLLWPRTAITRENAAKIEPGMTLDEVKMILCGPARDETDGRCGNSGAKLIAAGKGHRLNDQDTREALANALCLILGDIPT